MPNILQVNTGVTIKSDILAQMSSDTGIPTNDIEQLATSLAEAVADEEDELHYQEWKARKASYLRQSTGKALDFFGADFHLMNKQNLTRDIASRAVGFARFTGTVGVTVPRGSKIAKAATSILDQVVFETMEDGQVGGGGTVDIPIRAQTYGSAGNLTDSTITTILDSVSGVSAVTNPAATALGRDEESDEDYRARILRAIDGLARGTVPSLIQGTMDFRVFSVTLAKAATSTQTFLEVEENLNLNQLPTTGTLGINSNEEVVTYNGFDLAVNPHRLTGVQRGKEGTTAIEHSAGVDLREYIPLSKGDRVTSMKLVEGHGVVNIYIDDGSAAGPDLRLVALVRKRLIGEGTERNPGYRGHAITVTVDARSALTVSPITASVKLKPGYTAATVQNAVTSAVADWINSLGVDVDVRAYAMACVIQDVEGVETMTALSIANKTFDGGSYADFAVGAHQVARTSTGNISIFAV